MHAHRDHPRENAVYQRSDLLHRTDKSQDNYGSCEQQDSLKHDMRIKRTIRWWSDTCMRDKPSPYFWWLYTEGEILLIFSETHINVITGLNLEVKLNFNLRIQKCIVTMRINPPPLTTYWHFAKQHCINIPSQKVICFQTESTPPPGDQKHPPLFAV